MSKNRWVAQLSEGDESGKAIDRVVRAGKATRADALAYFAANHLKDLADHLKREQAKRLDEWDG